MRQSRTFTANHALAAKVPAQPGWLERAMRRIHRSNPVIFLLIVLASAGAEAQGQSTDLNQHIFSVDPRLVVAQPCGDVRCTYRWTLASRLGQAMDMAEDLFGPRDRSYTILGIEFTTDAQPSHWYPKSEYGSSEKQVIVLLTSDAASNEDQALFQLSHESFHLLSSTVFGSATNLEEGLATSFSLWYMAQIGRPLSADYIDMPKYRRAFEDVQALMKLYPDMAARIKRFRTDQPSRAAATISYNELHVLFPNAPVQLAKELTETFQ